PASRSGFVALAGWTNVGKSTLLNRVVGEKIAAVADVPQTTRNRISGVLTVAERGQAVFVDTPGFHRPKFRMNRNMVDLARESLGGVDLIVLVIDAAHGLGPGDEEAATIVKRSGRPHLVALNKIDRLRSKTVLLPMIEQVAEKWGLTEVMPISAQTGEGCTELVDRVFESLPEGAPLYPEDTLTDQPERALAAEWIREKLVRRTREEVPHATAVSVERWLERDDGVVEIEAAVIVERESQKGIVIGRGGRVLKEVGTEAREELERLLNARVFLRLWVKVRSEWRNDDKMLRELGL
ncbi:MAG: GTPase Era, partial [Acidobacteriota bacterium]|nr:GTPase Era [Acidobacteriota bacterium]